MGKHYQKPIKPSEKSELRFVLSPPPKGKLANGGKYSAHVEHDQTFAVPEGIAAGEYVLVTQRMNPDRRSFARTRHKVRI